MKGGKFPKVCSPARNTFCEQKLVPLCAVVTVAKKLGDMFISGHVTPNNDCATCVTTAQQNCKISYMYKKHCPV